MDARFLLQAQNEQLKMIASIQEEMKKISEGGISGEDAARFSDLSRFLKEAVETLARMSEVKR